MKVIFFGTGAFGLPTLQAIHSRPEYDLCGVVTGPDKPQGRGQKILPTPVGTWAEEHSFSPVWKPDRLRAPEFAACLREVNADVFVVVAYRILPERIFVLARHAFNLHASLLPAYRGAAPIPRAIMAGEAVTGVTTFLLQQTVDTGGILRQKSTAITPGENAGQLTDRLAQIGAGLVSETLKMIADGPVVPRPQDESMASPAPKIEREDRLLDFNANATELINRVRALAPSPAALARFHGKLVKMLALDDAERMTDHPGKAKAGGRALPGEILIADPRSRLVLACGDGALTVGLIQPEGKACQSGAEFVRGYRVQAGERFERV